MSPRSNPQLKAASPALAGAQQKTGNGSRRAGWRSFGEYIFLEDSRYASQRKNTRRKRVYPPCTPSLDPSCGGRSASKTRVNALRTRASIGGQPAFRFAAKRATYCADGRK